MNDNININKNKNKKDICRKNYKGEFRMATQIAVTPVLYGEIAKTVYREASKKPTKKSESNGKKLLELFNLNSKE